MGWDLENFLTFQDAFASRNNRPGGDIYFVRDSCRVRPSRYPGARLREIRAHGQRRECARRRAQMARAAAKKATA